MHFVQKICKCEKYLYIFDSPTKTKITRKPKNYENKANFISAYGRNHLLRKRQRDCNKNASF